MILLLPRRSRGPLQAGLSAAVLESSCLQSAQAMRRSCCSQPSFQWTVFLSQDTNGYSLLALQEEQIPVGELLSSLGRSYAKGHSHQEPTQV